MRVYIASVGQGAALPLTSIVSDVLDAVVSGHATLTPGRDGVPVDDFIEQCRVILMGRAIGLL